MKRKHFYAFLMLALFTACGNFFDGAWGNKGRPTPTWGIVVDRYYRPETRIICVDEAALFKPSKTKPKITYTSRTQTESYTLVIVDSTRTEWNLEVDRKQFFQTNLMDTVSLKGHL
jgi:hypothetical protein